MHVDDGNGVSFDPAITLVKSTLELRYGTLTRNSESKGHTGTTLTRHPSGAISLDLHDHILKVLKTVGMDSIPGALTPTSSDIFPPSTNTSPTPIKFYQQVVGDLTHISRIRKDIVKETRQHAKQASSPAQGDLQRVIRTLRSLKSFPATPVTYYTTPLQKDQFFLVKLIPASLINPMGLQLPVSPYQLDLPPLPSYTK